MLESIISPGTAEKDPWDMAILGFIIASVSVWVGYYLADYITAPASILTLVVAVMAVAPLVQRVLAIEEEKDERACSARVKGVLARHVDVIGAYSFLFIGLLVAFSLWYVILPYHADGIPSGAEVFSLQNATIGSLQKQINTGHAVGYPEGAGYSEGAGYPEGTGYAIADGAAGAASCPQPAQAEADARQKGFVRLYSNNMRVMLFCFLASFLFGAGALWILTWNASVIAVFIGNKIKAGIASSGGDPLHAYATGFPVYSLGIALWAIPEVLAYLVAAIGGGIISVAVMKHHFRSEAFWLTVFDGTFFMIIAAFLVVLGAYVEHFFLPA